MNTFKLLVAGVTLSLTVGCTLSPKEPGVYIEDHYTYDPSKSEALNVWHRAGMSVELHDVELPEGTVIDSSFWDSGTGTIAGAALVGNTASMAGLSGGLFAATDIIGGALVHTVAERNRVIFWMPKEEGETELEARKRLTASFEVAAVSAYERMGFEIRGSVTVAQLNVLTAGAVAYGNGDCELDNRCMSTLLVYPLDFNDKLWIETASTQTEFSRFDIDSSQNGFINDRGYSQLDLLVEISKGMPEWFHMYIAPRRLIIDEEGNYNEIPFMINQGNINLFVKPQ
ncbi:hypothetical protein [uncultured Umboniibacter sp.]|uniref:hypothetical protein n=1 Tax=uncultured Umboniibacter sp. TaxID=1798917 RepID=UPI00261BAF89|nr:hypothetical protein [uncultured Umboniibacter sp.]